MRQNFLKTPSNTNLDTMIVVESDYPEFVIHSLKQFFPGPSLLELSGPQVQMQFEKHLPLFRWKWVRHQLKLHFVCRHRLNIAKFFFEMIHRWLLPGRRLDVSSFFSTDFHLNQIPHSLYTIAEMTLRLETNLPRDSIEHNLKIIETELRLGMMSVYHASRLLETHFASPQQKNSQIQEKITKLIQRKPDEIDYDIFGQLQQFIVMSREEFKTHRTASHLSRVVTVSYLFARSIEKAREAGSDKRHVRLKLGPVVLDLPWGPKEVLGVCIGLNLLSKDEIFEERHLLRALQNGQTGIKVVPDSFYVHEGQHKDIVVLYLEIEKEDGELFTQQELNHLKRFLPEEVQRSVEIPLKSLFMPRNEEEILRYIVALAGQLRFVRDLPQVILMFDEQKGGELYFTVIVVRILFPTSYSIQYLFGQNDTPLKFIPDRVKRVGLLRKRYPKESTVFRVSFPSKPFLREDQSVDLFRARQTVFEELEKIIGSLRDYTGGMIAKQVELMDQVQALIGEADPSSSALLEPFFHTIYPVEARSFLIPEQIKNWLVLWKELIEFPEDEWKVDRDLSAVYVIGKRSVIPELDFSDFGEGQLIRVSPEYGGEYLGYLFITTELAEQESFIDRFQAIQLVFNRR